MTDHEFVDYLRLRLLQFPVVSYAEDAGVICPCRGEEQHVEEFPTHALDCNLNRDMYTLRHNNVRDALYTLLRSVMPGSTVTKEMHITREPTPVPIRSDIVVVDGGYRIVIDVTITDPACRTHTDHGAESGAAFTPDTGAKLKEKHKRQKYGTVPLLCVEEKVFNDTGPIDPYIFVPFAVEATGRLGPAALELMNYILRDPIYHNEVSHFYYVIGASIARNNSRMIFKNRRNVEFLEPPPLEPPPLPQQTQQPHPTATSHPTAV